MSDEESKNAKPVPPLHPSYGPLYIKKKSKTSGNPLTPRLMAKGFMKENLMIAMDELRYLNPNTGEEELVPKAISNTLVRLAINGDMRAIELIFDRLDGKMVQQTEELGNKAAVNINISEALIERLNLNDAERTRLRLEMLREAEKQRGLVRETEPEIIDVEPVKDAPE